MLSLGQLRIPRSLRAVMLNQFLAGYCDGVAQERGCGELGHAAAKIPQI
jgi:hypothetical protein